VGRVLWWSILKLAVTADGENSENRLEKVLAAFKSSTQTNVETRSLENIYPPGNFSTQIFNVLSPR
jgi:hypothetical protein